MRVRSFGLLFLLALMTSCAEVSDDIQMPIKGVTINATTHSTRTTFDGESTIWSEDDKLQVAIGADSETPRVEEFVYDSSLANTFVNDQIVLTPNTLYNAYALYYAQDVLPEESDMTATVMVGAATQQQTAESSSHIAPLDPLFGKAEGVSYDNIGVEMMHTAVVLKIDIANTTDETIAGIRSLTISAPEGICLSGNRKIDFATLSTSALDDSSGSNIVTVNVESSGAIAAGETFTVWAATAPFAIEDAELNFALTTTDDKTLLYTKTFDGECIFRPGYIMETTIAPTLLAESLTLRWGYLDGYVEPNWPNDDKQANSSGVQDSRTEFTLDGYHLVVVSDCTFEYRSTTSCIRFDGISLDDNVHIHLPMIPNYKLSHVSSHIRYNSSAPRPVSIGIVSSDDTSFEKISKKTNSATNDYDLTGMTSSEYQYSICIEYSANNSSTTLLDLTGIELTYVLDK